MALPLSRAARVRVIPFAVFMGLLALRGGVPADGSWGIDPRWIYGVTVVAVGSLLAAWWREYGELSRQVLPSLRECLLGVGVGLVGGKSDVGLLGQSFLSKFQVSMSRDQMVLRR